MTREIILKNLREYWKINNIPNITEVNANFLKKLIKINRTKNMLEIGTANWLSAIEFWTVLEEIWWKLTTIEFSSNSYSQAKENVENMKLENTVNLLLWNALEIIPTLEEKYDFVFIDWMKRRTLDFLKLVWGKVDKWWVIIIDDVIKFSEKMLWLKQYLADGNIDNVVIPIDEDDGVMLIVI